MLVTEMSITNDRSLNGLQVVYWCERISPAEKAKQTATRGSQSDLDQRRLAHEGRTTCEKRVQLYGQCVLARESNAEKYDHDPDGRDDCANDHQDEG